MNVSRRAFISRGSLGIAMAGALAAVPGLTAMLRLAPPSMAPGASSASTAGPLIAHVRDLTSGEISLMVGTDQVIVRDIDLAARLYGAARRPVSKGR